MTGEITNSKIWVWEFFVFFQWSYLYHSAVCHMDVGKNPPEQYPPKD